MSFLGIPPSESAAQERTDTSGIRVDLEVVDGDSGQPIENVIVRIPELGTNLITDSLGRASLVDIDVGSYRLILTRMGYEAERGAFTVERAGAFRIAMTPVLMPSDAEPGDVVGRVIDPETGEGVAGAEVTIAGVLRRASDDNGWFTVELVPAGAHVIEVAYLGRQTVRDSIFVRDGQTLEVQVPLAVEAIELEGITVTAHAHFLSGVGYFRRQRGIRGMRGRQWSAEAIADRDPGYLQYMLTEVPMIRRAVPAAGEGTNVRLVGRGGCRLQIFVDDFPMDEWFDLDAIDPNRVAAMEVYYGSPIPLRYMQYPCGVILVWLKRR